VILTDHHIKGTLAGESDEEKKRVRERPDIETEEDRVKSGE
jgi:hypothetical protein